jgi:methylmalonyl-CoA mutase N-terminal domain/subunit
VEAGIVPRAALTAAEQEIVQLKEYKNAAEQEIAQLKSDKVADKARRTNLRKLVKEARDALASTKALLHTANKLLVKNKLGPVMAKVAPTPNGTDGQEDPLSDNTNPMEVTQDLDEEDPTQEGEEEEL